MDKNQAENLTEELIDQHTNSLPPLWIISTGFIMIVSLIRYVYFKEIFLVSEGRAEDFIFRNFLVYNLGWNFLTYPFKFLGLLAVFMFGSFLFQVQGLRFSTYFRIIILAEMIKYLPQIIKIIWFSYFAPNDLLGFDLKMIDAFLTLGHWIGLTDENAVYPLLKYLSIPQILYVVVISKMFQNASGKTFSYHLQWAGITYGTMLLLVGLVSIIISL